MHAPSQLHTPSYTLQEYDDYLTRTKERNQELKKTLFFVAAVAFCAGLIAIYFGWTIVAVVLLAVAVFFHQGNSHCVFLDDVLDTQWHLALFINSHTKYLEALRSDEPSLGRRSTSVVSG